MHLRSKIRMTLRHIVWKSYCYFKETAPKLNSVMVVDFSKPNPLHSEKFKMNEEVDSLLSEKVSNFLLTWKVTSITVHNKIQIHSDWLTLPNFISGWETLRSNLKMESASSVSILVLRVFDLLTSDLTTFPLNTNHRLICFRKIDQQGRHDLTFWESNVLIVRGNFRLEEQWWNFGSTPNLFLIVGSFDVQITFVAIAIFQVLHTQIINGWPLSWFLSRQTRQIVSWMITPNC